MEILTVEQIIRNIKLSSIIGNDDIFSQLDSYLKYIFNNYVHSSSPHNEHEQLDFYKHKYLDLTLILDMKRYQIFFGNTEIYKEIREKFGIISWMVSSRLCKHYLESVFPNFNVSTNYDTYDCPANS